LAYAHPEVLLAALQEYLAALARECGEPGGARRRNPRVLFSFDDLQICLERNKY
jgi:hypothetical protein